MSATDSRRMSIGHYLRFKTLNCLTVNSVEFLTASRTTEKRLIVVTFPQLKIFCFTLQQSRIVTFRK